jgi:hypothetical protein
VREKDGKKEREKERKTERRGDTEREIKLLRKEYEMN